MPAGASITYVREREAERSSMRLSLNLKYRLQMRKNHLLAAWSSGKCAVIVSVETTRAILLSPWEIHLWYFPLHGGFKQYSVIFL